MNKTIFMTYKQDIPNKVKERWLEFNSNYNIDLSLDCDCERFLLDNFNNNIYNLFKSIDKGMYKADLWRYCKLYKNTGVYADVDLVPYLNIDTLDKDISFYTCLSECKEHCFQALMINNGKPNDPLLLVILLSYLINKPYLNIDGVEPCRDMLKCIKYILNLEDLEYEKKYITESLKLKICIGSCTRKNKQINLYYFPHDIDYTINLHKNEYPDTFSFKIIDNYLFVERMDRNSGWGHNHYIDICFNSNASFFFFKENYNNNFTGDERWIKSYVTLNNKKILDSRDLEYHKNKGWQSMVNDESKES